GTERRYCRQTRHRLRRQACPLHPRRKGREIMTGTSMLPRFLLCLPLLLAPAALAPAEALAQMMSTEQPVVYSKTVIAIVPGDTIPKTISQAPELMGALK